MAGLSTRFPTSGGAREGVELELLIVAVLDRLRGEFDSLGLRVRVEHYPAPLRVRAPQEASIGALEAFVTQAMKRVSSGSTLVLESGRADEEVFVRVRSSPHESVGEIRGAWIRERILAEVSVALLAGGHSRRMGRNKALIEWKGATFLQRLVQTLEHLTDDLFICGDADGAYHGLEVPVIPDLVPGCGPLGGVATALSTARHPRCFVAPCDVPLLDPRLVDALAWRATDRRAVVLRSPAGIEPLVGVYSKGCRAEIDAALREGRWKMQSLLSRLDPNVVDLVAELPVIDPRCLVNVNTPEDLAQLRRLTSPPSE